MFITANADGSSPGTDDPVAGLVEVPARPPAVADVVAVSDGVADDVVGIADAVVAGDVAVVDGLVVVDVGCCATDVDVHAETPSSRAAATIHAERLPVERKAGDVVRIMLAPTAMAPPEPGRRSELRS